jgi:hypothetical protein
MVAVYWAANPVTAAAAGFRLAQLQQLWLTAMLAAAAAAPCDRLL